MSNALVIPLLVFAVAGGAWGLWGLVKPVGPRDVASDVDAQKEEAPLAGKRKAWIITVAVLAVLAVTTPLTARVMGATVALIAATCVGVVAIAAVFSGSEYWKRPKDKNDPSD